MDDVFGIFDDGSSPAPKAPLLPRASDHPHFLACSSLWCIPAQDDALSRYSDERADSIARSLRRSSSAYGRACASSLLSARDAFRSGGAGNPALGDHARAIRDLCAATLEEMNWDSPCWQEANLLALCYILSALLSEERDAKHSASEIGLSAIALFNLAISTVCSTSSPPAWMACVSTLFQQAEAAVGQAHPSANAAHLSETGIWKIPVRLPCCNVPAIDDTRRVLEHSSAALPCATFFTEYLRPGQPVLIRGHLDAEEWAAMEYFADLRALHSDVGARLVPISLGSPLVNYGGVVHWPLRKLIEECLLPSNFTHDLPRDASATPDEETHCRVAYMSQHHLLHQHPALQRLLAIPPHTLGRELSPTNVWIGTRGTVTSLHSDPSDNLLCQVAGFKYFRLYGLDQTPKLHATILRAQNTNSFGTSPIRVEATLPPEHASAKEAEYVEGILGPGDMLFIPKSIWHYVRSLTTSVSINFWF